MVQNQKMKILIFSLLLWTVDSSRILGIFPTADIDHFTLGIKLMDALAEKGHEITMITPFTPEDSIGNLTVVQIHQEIVLETVNRFTSSFVKQIDVNFISATTNIYSEAYKTTEALLSDQNFQSVLQSDNKYDIIIAEYFMNEAVLGVASYFNVPIVLLSPYPSSSLMNELFANPTPPAYIPNILTGHTGTMGFGERMHNVLCDIFNKHYKYFVALPRQNKLLRKYIREDFNIADVITNISLVLLNSHPSVSEPVSHSANMIEVGGMHINVPKKLPEDLEKFVNGSEGTIYFSLDSKLKSSSLGKEKVAEILKGLARLQNINVVWNLVVDVDVGKVPENVMFVEDLSHQDILAHEKVVASVIDGNLLRILETVHFKKPFVGIPLVYDQKSNIARAVQDGYGIELPFYELSGENLYQAIQQVRNGLYTVNAQKRSDLLKDQLVSPLETAVYWVEYAIRHEGAKHLQSPGVHLSLFKRHLMDIIILLTVIDIILFLIFYYIFKHIIHHVKRKYRERKSKNYSPLDEKL